MRWLLAIIVAAAVGAMAYGLGLEGDVVYMLRSITRHLVAYGV